MGRAGRLEPQLDLRRLLQRRVPIAPFLSLAHARCLFCASRHLRAALSGSVRVLLRLEILSLDETPEELALARLRVHQCRIRVLQEPVTGPLPLYFRLPASRVPLDMTYLAQRLGAVVPMVCWDSEELEEQLTLACRGEHVQFVPAKRVVALWGCQPWLLEREDLQVSYMEITLSQICGMPAGMSFPTISKVKVFCSQPAAAADDSLLKIYDLFPGLRQLHLSMRPNVLPPMCLSNFVAASDCQISFDEVPGAQQGDGLEGSLFMAAHLLTMPFSGEGGLFQCLQRLQMDTLQFQGGALDQLAAALAAAPQLRRLGSVQLKLLRMLEPAARGSFKLEEAVVVMEIEDCLSLFNMMLPLTTSHSRCSLKRLGLHMRAPDGLLPPHEEVEGFLCSGFASVAECLAPGGFIHFTHSQAQLAETVFFQLPFVEPDLFSGDMASCTRLASSTPLDRPLRRVEPLPELRASGTLISGPLRPTMAELASQKLRTQKYDLHSVLPEGMQLKLMHVIDRLGAWKEEMGFRS